MTPSEMEDRMLRDQERMRRMVEKLADLTARNERQAETIERYRSEYQAKTDRFDTQQGMINWLRARVEKLEAQTTPEAIAERLFANEY